MKTSTLVLLGIGLYFLTRKTATAAAAAPTGNSPLNGPQTAPYLPGWDSLRDFPGNADPLRVYAAYGQTSLGA